MSQKLPEVAGHYQVFEDQLAYDYPKYVEDWRAPVGLSALGYKAAERIVRALIAIEESGKDFALYAGQKAFRTPEEISQITGHPPFGELGIVYDGGNHARWFRDNWSVIDKALKPLGMYLEQINGWTSVVVRAKRVIRTRRNSGVLRPTAHPKLGDTLEVKNELDLPGIGKVEAGATAWFQSVSIDESDSTQPWQATVFFPGIGHWNVSMDTWGSLAPYMDFFPGIDGVFVTRNSND